MMPSGCTRCKLFHKEEQWIDEYNGTIQRSSCYCKMSTTPDLYLINVNNNIILDIPKENK